ATPMQEACMTSALPMEHPIPCQQEASSCKILAFWPLCSTGLKVLRRTQLDFNRARLPHLQAMKRSTEGQLVQKMAIDSPGDGCPFLGYSSTFRSNNNLEKDSVPVHQEQMDAIRQSSVQPNYR